ncbi:MAG: acyl-CoA dehydrogenase family protein, partial [Proteobacteria bacterium]|nr:acyl-CoA dehydrogenase family protein [Pseudomonadota bacterium]
MNFDFSDDLKQLKDEARKFLEDKCPSAIVRRVLEGDEAYDEALWREMADMGWLGAA